MNASDGGIWSIVPYGSFTQYTPALPQFYWDVYSAEQRVKHICYEIDKIIAYADMLGVNINATHDDVVKLQQQFEQFQQQGLADLYEKLLNQWIQDHMFELWQTFAKQVFFGLTEDGHFCAYVPESWSDITFDTGMVYGRSDYGRLILRFTADNSIDNTYSYTISKNTTLQQLVADMESVTNRSDATFDTVFTNMDAEVPQSGNI